MDRITQGDLEYLVDRINEVTKSPMEPWTKQEKGIKANIGNYHLDYAYGGVKLVRMESDGGGISVVSTGGYGTKKDLYTWMSAFLSGIVLDKTKKV